MFKEEIIGVDIKALKINYINLVQHYPLQATVKRLKFRTIF